MANHALRPGRIATAAAHDQQAGEHLAAWHKTRCQGRNPALRIQSAHVPRVNRVHSAAVARAATLSQDAALSKTRGNAVIALQVLPWQHAQHQQVLP